jgi:hypothetical protein
MKHFQLKTLLTAMAATFALTGCGGGGGGDDDAKNAEAAAQAQAEAAAAQALQASYDSLTSDLNATKLYAVNSNETESVVDFYISAAYLSGEISSETADTLKNNADAEIKALSDSLVSKADSALTQASSLLNATNPKSTASEIDSLAATFAQNDFKAYTSGVVEVLNNYAFSLPNSLPTLPISDLAEVGDSYSFFEGNTSLGAQSTTSWEFNTEYKFLDIVALNKTQSCAVSN